MSATKVSEYGLNVYHALDIGLLHQSLHSLSHRAWLEGTFKGL